MDVHIFELFDLQIFIGIRLDFADPLDRVLHSAVDIGDLTAYPSEPLPHLPSVFDSPEEHEGKGGQSDESKDRIEPEHEEKGTEDQKDRKDQVFGSMMGYFSDGIEVIGDTGHDMPGLGVIKVVEREFLNMPEDIFPHIILHPHTEDMPPLHPDEFKDHLDQIDEEHKEKRGDYGPDILVRDMGVQKSTDHGRDKNSQDRGQESHPHIDKKEKPVGFIISDKPFDHDYLRSYINFGLRKVNGFYPRSLLRATTFQGG
jgi:hypothetical protein